MTFDGSSAGPASTAVLRGSAQHAIREFLTLYRCLPGRRTSARVFGRSPLSEDCASHYQEAVGQLEVAGRLDRLGEGWNVLHGLPGSVPPGESEPAVIDHLVIGPAGVFSVATYNHSGERVWVSGRAFVVDGHRRQHIRLAEAAVGYVERMLEAAVGRHTRATTIIAVIDAGSLEVRDLPRDVFVVAAESLDSWLKARERELAPASVAELAASARLADTWSRVPLPSADVTAMERERSEFDRVRREVAIARWVRIAWAVGAVAVPAFVVVGVLQWAGAPLW